LERQTVDCDLWSKLGTPKTNAIIDLSWHIQRNVAKFAESAKLMKVHDSMGPWTTPAEFDVSRSFVARWFGGN